MAQPNNGNDNSGGSGPRQDNFIVSLAAAIVVGVLGGGGFGYFVTLGGPAPPKAKEPAEQVESRSPATGRFPNDAFEMDIPSIIVDLSGTPKSQVRLDLSAIVAHGTLESGSLKSEIREDVIAYLKGVTVADIEGVRGFQNLREQLDDRAKIRGRGAVLGLLIGGLVVE